MNSQIELNGYLDAELNGSPVYIQAKDNHIQVTSPSFNALRKVFSFFHHKEIKNKLPLSFMENSLSISYFINDELVAQSGYDVLPSWYGKFLGFDRLKINGFSLMKTMIFGKSSK